MAEVNDNWEHLTSLADNFPEIKRYMSAKPAAAKGQMVRYLDLVQNRDAGKIFNRCNQPPHWDVGHTSTITQTTDGVETEWIVSRIDMTRTAFTLDFPGLDGGTDYGIEENECVPYFNGASHWGYALFNDDKWFNSHPEEEALQDVYKQGPAAIPANRKRWVDSVGLVVSGANATRVATDEELRKHMGFDACSGIGCAREMRALRHVVDVMKEKSSRPGETSELQGVPSAPFAVAATPTVDAPTVAMEALIQAVSDRKASLPRETGFVDVV